METNIPKPCIDKDEVDSSSSTKNTISPQSPSLSTSNSHSSPNRDRTKDGTETSRMLLQSQSRLRISRQGVVQPLQSQDGNESPATKRSFVEEKADGLPPLAPSRAAIRAISSNHDSPNPRGRYDDAVTETALSRENLRDTSRDSTVLVTVAEQKEFPSDSSPGATNGGTTERTVDRAVASAAGSEGVVSCRNPPMKRAKILGTNDVEGGVIRIPTSTETQITTPKPKLVTLTGTGICASASTNTNHITQNNTANPPSPKTGDNNSDLSMAVLQESNAIAKSSTTESSSTSSLTPTGTPASATATTTAIHSKASLSSTCTRSGCGETMSAKGNAVENALPLTRCESDNTTCTSNSKPATATTTKIITTTKESITINDSSSEGKVSTSSSGPSVGTKPQTSTTVKPEPATPKQQSETTPTMSVIKASVVRQALSSAPTNSLPANQVKPAPTHVHKTSIPTAPPSSSTSTPSTAPTKKKRPVKRKRSGSNGGSSSNSPKPKGQSSGRWTQEEHQAFLEGLTECGREWKKVALRIPTRTSAQIRSHAQKYFAKLQRDQESSATSVHAGLVHGGDYPFATAAPMTPTGLVVGVGGLSGTIITAPNAATLAPSVRRNVERIVANPRAAQREVETTMVALRERYRQLQQRLEERRRKREERKKLREQQQQQQSQPFSPASHHTAASSDVSTFASPPGIPVHPPQPQQQQQQQVTSSSGSGNPGKPMHNPASRRSPTGDDNSSVCSNVSSIAASRTDLGNEEIIALQVLGGDLPRSESASDIHVMGGDVLQGRGDSSIEASMPLMNENISSASYDHQLAPLPGVGSNNDNDSLMDHPQGDSVTTTTANNENTNTVGSNGGGETAAASGSISVGGISALEDPTTMATNATTAT